MPKLFYPFLVAALMLFCVPAPAIAQDGASGDPFLVRSVTVDVKAKNAVEARRKALAEARRKGYQMLGENMTDPVTPGDVLSIPSDGYIARVVRDVEVVDEKISANRYVGTFDVRFSPGVSGSFRYETPAVPVEEEPVMAEGEGANPASPTQPATAVGGEAVAGEALQPADPAQQQAAVAGDDLIYSPKRGGAVIDTAAGPVLVLPWYGPVSRQVLWSETNSWRAAWDNALRQNTGGRQIIMPLGDSTDIQQYSPLIPQGGTDGLARLMTRYGAREAIVTVAEPATGGMTIRSYRFDGRQMAPLQEIAAQSGPNGDASAQGIAAVIAEINNPQAVAPTAMPDDMAATQAPGQPGIQSGAVPSASAQVTGSQASVTTYGGSQQYATLARFSGLPQWVAMRNTLRNLPGIGGIDILSISPVQAKINFNFAGDPARLQNLLAQNGMTLLPLPQGEAPYELRMGRVY